MALFGTDMVEVTTPDGRRLTVPSQLAAQFPGLQPVQPTAPQQLGPSLGGTVPGPLQPLPEVVGSPGQLAPPAPGPIAAPDQPAPTITSPPPPSPVTSPVQTPQLGPTGTPRPLTDAELATRGVSAGLQQSDAALEEKRRAVDAISAQQQDEAKRQAAIQEEANQKSQAALEKAAADADKTQADLDKMMADRNTAVQKIADTKIDRESDHPVLAGIGLVLGALGTAMNNRSAALSAAFLGQAAPTPQQNPAIAAFYQAIDRKVAAQMDSIAKGRLDVAAMGQQIDLKQQLATNRAGVANTLRAAALEQANRNIEALKTRLGGDAAKANATSLQADISMKQATLSNEAAQQAKVNLQAENDRKDRLLQHRETLGVQYATLGEHRRHNIAEEQIQQQQRDTEALKALRAGKSDEAKLIRERAMGGEVTPVLDKDGKPVLDENGQPKFNTGLITMKNGDVWIPNGTEASITTLQKKHAAYVAYVQTLDEIRKLDPEWLSNTANSEKSQQLQQLMGNARLQAIALKDLGVPTGHDIELAENFIGTSDPTRRKDSIAGIVQSRATAVRDHNVELESAGLDKKWVPPDLGRKGAVAAPEDEAIDETLSNPRRRNLTPDDVVKWKKYAELNGIDTSDSNLSWLKPARKLWDKSVGIKDEINDSGKVTFEAKVTLDAWEKAFNGPDPVASKKAGEYLYRAAETGNSEIRRLAKDALERSVRLRDYPEETSVRSKSVARDSLSAPRAKSAPDLKRDSAGNPI